MMYADAINGHDGINDQLYITLYITAHLRQ